MTEDGVVERLTGIVAILYLVFLSFARKEICNFPPLCYMGLLDSIRANVNTIDASLPPCLLHLPESIGSFEVNKNLSTVRS